MRRLIAHKALELVLTAVLVGTAGLSVANAQDDTAGVDLETRNRAYKELMLGLQSLYEGDETAAEEHCRAALAINPLDAEAHFHLGCILGGREGERAAKLEAIVHFAQASAITPQTSTGQSSRAWIVGLGGRPPGVVLMSLGGMSGYTSRLVGRCAERLRATGHPVVPPTTEPDSLDWDKHPGEAAHLMCVNDQGQYVAGYVMAVGCGSAQWLDVPYVGRIPVAGGTAIIGDPIAKMGYSPITAHSSDSGGRLLLKLVGVDVLTLDRAVDELAENLVDSCLKAIESRPWSEFEGEVYYPVAGNAFYARALRRAHDRAQIQQYPTVAFLGTQSPSEELDSAVASAQNRLEWKVVHSDRRDVGLIYSQALLRQLGDAASMERAGLWIAPAEKPEDLLRRFEALKSTGVRFGEVDKDAPLDTHDVLIIERADALSPDMVEALRKYVEQGGGLVLSGYAPWALAGSTPQASRTVATRDIASWLGAGMFRRRLLTDCAVTTSPASPLRPDDQVNVDPLTLWQIKDSVETAVVVLDDLAPGAEPVAEALKRDEPNLIAYRHEYGKGRVYYQAVPRAEYQPKLEALYLQGVRWASKLGEVDPEVLARLREAGAERLAWLDFSNIDIRTESGFIGFKQKAIVEIAAKLHLIDPATGTERVEDIPSRKSASGWLQDVSDKRIRLLNECLEAITDKAAALIAAPGP
jgi:hypothetical protein